MDIGKLKQLLRAFVLSQFNYCPVVWMFCDRTLKCKVHHVHERHYTLRARTAKMMDNLPLSPPLSGRAFMDQLISTTHKLFLEDPQVGFMGKKTKLISHQLKMNHL